MDLWKKRPKNGSAESFLLKTSTDINKLIPTEAVPSHWWLLNQ